MAQIGQRTRLSTVVASISADGTVASPTPNHAPVGNGEFNQELTGGSTAAFSARFTDPDSDTLTYGALRLPSGYTATTGGVMQAPSVIAADTAPSRVYLYADDGKDTGEVTSLEVFSASSGDHAIRCGVVVPDLAVQSGYSLALYSNGVELPSQVRVGHRPYASGYEKMFQVRSTVALSGEAKHISVRPRATAYSGTNVTLAQFIADAPDVRVIVSGGATGTFRLLDALSLSSPVDLWEGPVCCEIWTNSQQISGSLRIQWQAIFYGAGQYAFRAQVACGSLNNADKVKYNLSIELRVEGSIIATWSGVDIYPDKKGWLYAETSDALPYRVGGLKFARFYHDADQWESMRILPPLAARDFTATERDNAYKSDSGGTGFAYLTTWNPLGTFRGTPQGDTTGRVEDLSMQVGHGGTEDDIGIVRRWDLMALYERNDSLYKTSLINALGHNYQIEQREPGSMLPANPATAGRENLSWQDGSIKSWDGAVDANADTRLIGANSGYYPCSHTGDGYIAYLMYGDPWIAMSIQFQATHNHWHMNAGARSGVSGIINWQGRKMAWGMRTLFAARAVTPSGTLASWLNSSYNANVNHNHGYVGSNSYGIPEYCYVDDSPVSPSYFIVSASVSTAYKGIAYAWIDLQSVAMDAGIAAKVTAIADENANFFANIFGTAVPYQVAPGMYEMACPKAGGIPSGTWAQFWTQTKAKYGVGDPPGADIVPDGSGLYRFYFTYSTAVLMYHMMRGHAGAQAAWLRTEAASNLDNTLNSGTSTSTRRQATFYFRPDGVTHGT